MIVMKSLPFLSPIIFAFASPNGAGGGNLASVGENLGKVTFPQGRFWLIDVHIR